MIVTELYTLLELSFRNLVSKSAPLDLMLLLLLRCLFGNNENKEVMIGGQWPSTIHSFIHSFSKYLLKYDHISRHCARSLFLKVMNSQALHSQGLLSNGSY